MTAEVHHMSDYRAPAVLPAALTALSNWLVWRLVQKPGEKKPRKVPFYASGAPRGWPNGRPSNGIPTDAQPQVEQNDPLDRAALVSYDRAVAACVRGNYTGLGLAVVPDSGIVALDFDHCVKDTVILDPRVADLVAGTYTEFSPSGTGLRAFMAGTMRSRKDNADSTMRHEDGSRRDGLFDVEFFGDTGFVTITGNTTPDCELMGWSETVQPLTPEVLELYRQRFGSDGALVVRQGRSGDDDDLLGLTTTLGWTLDQAREILFACPADASREKWVLALMALHHELDGSAEGLELADEWSQTSGTNYSGRADVEGRWRSFGRGHGGGGTTTGLWLLSWRNECAAHLKYDATAEWKKELGQVTDEFVLREKLCPRISRDDRLDEMAREALAQMLFDTFKRMGTKYPIAQCRKLVAEREVEKGQQKKDLPQWLKDWVYVTEDDLFYRMDSEEWLSMQAFNARFNREMPVGEDGTITKSAAWTALENYRLATCVRAVYLPWADRLFTLEGVDCVNRYRQSSVPTPVDHLSSEGQGAVQVVLRHLNLIAGDRQEVVRTFLNWMAHNVQNPGVKIRWAPLVKGVEGDGKTLIGTLMAAVMGRPNVKNVSPKVLGTDFTGWAQGSALVVLEELKLTGHNRHDIVNALKPNITNDSIEVHKKGADSFDAINTTNYVAFTNFADALPLTDTDRRWWIVFTPFATLASLSARIGAGVPREVLGAYFDRINEVINQHRGELRRWLLDHVIDADFKPNGSAPLTDEKAVMIGMSVSDEEQSVKEALETGGAGVTEQVFSSSHLNSLVFDLAPDVSLATSAWSRLLVKMGYTRLPKKVKWRGRSEIIWVKGHSNWEPHVVRRVLDETVPEGSLDAKGSLNDDLF